MSLTPSSSFMALIVVVVIGILSSTMSEACFIRNCPIGGKRSLDSEPQRQCMKCGTDGQCVGPNICCGSSGCQMGGEAAAVCQKENLSSSPCQVAGESCGAGDSGNCVSDGICCDSESCASNSRCRTESRRDVLQLIRRLIQARDYE